MIKSYYKIDKLIAFLLCLWLFIDSINGFIIRESINFPLSIAYKLILIFVISKRLANFKEGYKILFFLSIYLIWQFFYYTIIVEVKNTIETFQFLFKPISTMIIYSYFTYLIIRFPTFAKRQINKIFKINFIVFAANLICGLFGLGYTSYQSAYGDIGFQGFFYAKNELGGVAAPLFIYFLIRSYYISKKQFTLMAFFVLILAFLLMTKTIIATTVVSIFSVIYINSKRKKLLGTVFLIGIVALIASFNLNSFLQGESVYAQQMMYVYSKDGIMGLIFSGRTDFAVYQLREFFNSFFYLRIFGLGDNRTAEMDPVDVMLNIGYLGVLIYIFIICFLIRKLKKNCQTNFYVPYVLVCDLLLIGMSCFAGHIFFSSTAGLFIAGLNSLVILKNKYEK